MNKKKFVLPLAALALALSAGGGIVAAAQADTTPNPPNTSQTKPDRPMRGHGHPGVHGTVTAVSDSTITVKNSDGTTYTVDTRNATASKIQTISLSDIAVGDTIGVDGVVQGTTVTARHVMDGVPQEPQGP